MRTHRQLWILVAWLAWFGSGDQALAARTIEVNGRLAPMAVPPEDTGGITFVPLGDVGRALGAAVQWDPESRTVEIRHGQSLIQLWLGKGQAKVDGQTRQLDFKPYVRRGFTMVPLRFIAEALGAQVGFDPAINRVQITTAARPANWPDYLAEFEPPAPLTWARFRVVPPDNMPQVLIPGGEFLMGAELNATRLNSNEGPPKTVFVSAFWMDLHEVTSGQYERFAKATERALDDHSRQTNPVALEPVSYVTDADALAYASWAGRELPSEAQWEKAARGGTTTAYSWGEEWDDAKGASGLRRRVASFPPNPFGLFDMSGNVWEWCRDGYDAQWLREMPARDPVNTAATGNRSMRGGSWYGGHDQRTMASRAGIPNDARGSLIGFRCVSPAP